MSLKFKWHLREAARFLLSIPFMTTACLIAAIVIRASEFREFGLGMYPGLTLPKELTVPWAVDTFWQLSVAPLLLYFPFTLAIDALIRRYVLKLNQF